jgi:integrase
MRGHIKQRSEGSWSIILELDKTPDGKRHQKWITFKGSHKQAETKLTELLRQRDIGNYVNTDDNITVRSFLTRWLAEYARINLSPRGYERYESICRVHLIPAIGKIPLTKLRSEHLQKLYTEKLESGLSPRTVKYIHVITHKALVTALKWNLINRNIADNVDTPKPNQSEMQIWNEEEMSQFLEAAKDTEYYALFYAALFTGARRSELLALRWKDIDLILGQIYINRGLHHLNNGEYVFSQPKTARSRRTIALSPSAIGVLSKYYDTRCMDAAMLNKKVTDDTLIFSDIVTGKPYRPNTISRAWTNLAIKTGIKTIRFHDARHTHASLMLKQGIHPRIVMERLGHSTISVTLDIYSHVVPGMQELAAQRFDDAFNFNHNRESNIPVSKPLAK